MKIKRLLIFLLLIIAIAFGGYIYINHFASEKTASLTINSNIDSDVFVNGENVGHEFPINKTYVSRMVVVKIQNYETNVYLQAGVKTFVSRNFEDGKQYGEVISFEKSDLNDPSMAIISNPTNAEVVIDDKVYGNTPLSINNISEGQHKLEVAVDGYLKRELQINVYKGYKLLGNFSILEVSSQNEKPAQKLDESKTIVKILDTPNGFLRVRKDPTTQSEEIFRVRTNEEYELKSNLPKNGFLEIRIDATRSGWVSDIYTATGSSEIKD